MTRRRSSGRPARTAAARPASTRSSPGDRWLWTLSTLFAIGLVLLVFQPPIAITAAYWLLFVAAALASRGGRKKDLSSNQPIDSPSSAVALAPQVSASATPPRAPRARNAAARPTLSSSIESMRSDQFFEAELKSETPEIFTIRSSAVPVNPRDLLTHWVPAGMRVQVQQRSLPDGLVYLCDNAERYRLERAEPSLIDESLPIARDEDFTVRHLPYYPTYVGASPAARGAYLSWLARGRRHPGADLGYVTLFFTGLERRAIIDARNDPAARDEIPAICNELEGLIATYKHSTFNWRARQLLAFCRAVYGPGELHELAVLPGDAQHEGKDLYHIALSLAYKERRELPARLLAAWYLHDPRFDKPAVVKRHWLMFTAVFRELRGRRFDGDFARWSPPLSTKSLQLTYKPVSLALREVQDSMPMPDVTSEGTGLDRLVETVALSAADELAGYSRFVARHHMDADDPVARLMLPCPLWPGPVWERLALIRADLYAGVDVTEPTTLAEFLAPVDAAHALLKVPVATLLAALEGYMGVGMEPDPRRGPMAPGPTTPVVFFSVADGFQVNMPGAQPPDQKHHARIARVSFLADLIRVGMPNPADAFEHARSIAMGLERLNAGGARRLEALLTALCAPGATTFKAKGTLKKQLESLDEADQVSLRRDLVAVARAGGALSAVKVIRHLEKLFALLGAEPKALYEFASTGSTGELAVPATDGRTAPPGALDIDRIEALRKETADVDNVLRAIFVDTPDESVEPPPETECVAPVHQPAAEPAIAVFSALPSLDARHAALLRQLINQQEWTAAAFALVCREHGLLPAGALERINDAAFDAFDEALLEGDDPIEFNPGPLEQLRS